MKDFFADISHQSASKRVPIDRVPASSAMKMFDGNIMVMAQSLAAENCPVVLNNACVSWHELAGRFMYGGARAYIGTITPILGVEAEGVAESLIQKHFGKPLSVALWHAQNEVYGKSAIRRPYILVGVHFQRLTSEYGDHRSSLKIKLGHTYNHWHAQKSRHMENSDAVQSIEQYIDYLQFELKGLDQ